MTIEEQTECGSITRNIRGAQSGDRNSVSILFHRYFVQLAALSRSFFQGCPRSSVDEEDIASAVIHSICRPESLQGIEDREALFRLLIASAKNRVRSVIRNHQAARRGNGHVTLYSDLDESLQIQFSNLQSTLTNPQIQAVFHESIAKLLARLDSDFERDVCKLRLKGETIESISEMLNSYTRKIDRKIDKIRAVWLEINQEDSRNDG